MEGLSTYEMRRSQNLFWCRQFWAWLDSCVEAQAISPDVDRALRRHGYFGAGTSTDVPAGLRPKVEGLRDTGAPASSAAGGVLVGSSQKLPIVDPINRGKLSVQLGPTLRRAAPEIYTACLSEGLRSSREWIEVNFAAQNGTDAWQELWGRGTRIRSAAARFEQDTAFRGSSDDIESTSARWRLGSTRPARATA